MYQGIIVTDVTDHYPIFHITHFEKVQSVEDDYYLTRKMNLKNYETFKLLISQYDWSRVTDHHVCQNTFQLFYNIKFIFDKAFPPKRVKKMSKMFQLGLRKSSKAIMPKVFSLSLYILRKFVKSFFF